jgi:hypothetical protein
MNAEAEIERQVRALETMDLETLREEWRRRWEPPPPLRSPQLLRHLIAWRIQADAWGGLDRETRRFLRRPSVARSPALRSGQRVVREWQGVRYEVEFVDGAFLHAGSSYRSLTEVARAITGARWNGPRFFGLRGDA